MEPNFKPCLYLEVNAAGTYGALVKTSIPAGYDIGTPVEQQSYYYPYYSKTVRLITLPIVTGAGTDARTVTNEFSINFASDEVGVVVVTELEGVEKGKVYGGGTTADGHDK